MKPYWISEIIIVTLFKIMPASGNAHREGESTSQMASLFFFVVFQSRMLF